MRAQKIPGQLVFKATERRNDQIDVAERSRLRMPSRGHLHRESEASGERNVPGLVPEE
jgi:hypothetical protein